MWRRLWWLLRWLGGSGRVQRQWSWMEDLWWAQPTARVQCWWGNMEKLSVNWLLLLSASCNPDVLPSVSNAYYPYYCSNGVCSNSDAELVPGKTAVIECLEGYHFPGSPVDMTTPVPPLYLHTEPTRCEHFYLRIGILYHYIFHHLPPALQNTRACLGTFASHLLLPLFVLRMCNTWWLVHLLEFNCWSRFCCSNANCWQTYSVVWHDIQAAHMTWSFFSVDQWYISGPNTAPNKGTNLGAEDETDKSKCCERCFSVDKMTNLGVHTPTDRCVCFKVTGKYCTLFKERLSWSWSENEHGNNI